MMVLLLLHSPPFQTPKTDETSQSEGSRFNVKPGYRCVNALWRVCSLGDPPPF